MSIYSILVLCVAVVVVMVVEHFQENINPILRKAAHKFLLISLLGVFTGIIISTFWYIPNNLGYSVFSYFAAEILYAILKYTGQIKKFFDVSPEHPAYTETKSLEKFLTDFDIMDDAIIFFLYFFIFVIVTIFLPFSL